VPGRLVFCSQATLPGPVDAWPASAHGVADFLSRLGAVVMTRDRFKQSFCPRRHLAASAETAAAQSRSAPRAGHGGIALILMTLVIFVSMDTLVKYLITHNSAPQIIWLRFLTNFLMAAAIVLGVPRLRGYVRTKALGVQLVRSLLLVATTSCFFFGLRYLKLADLVILNQAAPLMVVALSVLFLGEKVGPRRWLGVAFGFAGVLIILKPGFGFEWASLFGIGSATIYSVYQIMTRALSTRDHTMTTFFYTAIVGAVLGAPFAIYFWEWPSPLHFALMCLPGFIGGVGHLLLVMAFARSEASLLAPYFYSAIVLAVVTGWIFFGEIPDTFSFVGAALIAAAGLYVWHRERVAGKRRGQIPA